MPDSFNQITVSIADPSILPLIKRFFHSQGMRAQAAKSDDIVIARDNTNNVNQIIGALRLCPVEGSWLLRSMCIDETFQRQGVGLNMLNKIQANLSSKSCYCFPYTYLENFYEKAGFQIINTADAAPEIQTLYEQYLKSGKKISIMQFLQR